MTQYRRELATWRGEVLHAADHNEDEPLARVRHKLRPHLQLFGMAASAEAIGTAEAPASVLLEVMTCCDRALLRRQAELAATAGPAAG
jgi:hypothetical protein